MNEIKKRLERTKNRIDSVEFDAHWYRRVFHTFGASFLIYYMLPEIHWMNILKFWLPILAIIFFTALEILRVKGKISSGHFFCLKEYEKNRFGSYLYFGFAVAILLLFFPQQIAIPCILCGCIVDPIIGEARFKFGKKWAYYLGFLVSMLLFVLIWYKADVTLMLVVSIVGGLGAVVGEAKKFWLLDDDFMIQMVPAILVLILWICAPYFGFALPGEIIHPW